MSSIALMIGIVAVAQAPTFSIIINDIAPVDHITGLILNDIHLNSGYNEQYGWSTNCVADGDPVHTNSAPYGRYGCDPPTKTLDSAIEAIDPTDLDFVMLLGDLPAHLPAEEAKINAEISYVTSKVNTLNVTTYPVVGNSDCFPDYYLDTTGERLTYLADVWDHWLTDSQRVTFIEGGYYSADLSDNVVLLVLNTVWYSFRHEPTPPTDDPGNQFAWLSDQLHAVESANKYAVLAYHIPPGGNGYDDIPLWQDTYESRFLSIVESVSSISHSTAHGSVLNFAVIFTLTT